jgi:hypothetical protein
LPGALPQQQRRDQKAAECEEEIDPQGPLGQEAGDFARNRMVKHNGDDGEASKSIE